MFSTTWIREVHHLLATRVHTRGNWLCSWHWLLLLLLLLQCRILKRFRLSALMCRGDICRQSVHKCCLDWRCGKERLHTCIFLEIVYFC